MVIILKTGLQESSIDVFTNHVTSDTKKVHKLLNRLKANKSCGVDKILARLLKETPDTFAVPLSMLFNLSFKQGAYLNYGN